MNAETYEGTPCRRFGHTLRYTNGGKCVACAKAHGIATRASTTVRKRERYQTDPEYRARTREQDREYRSRNADTLRARQRAWYAADRVRLASRVRALKMGFRDEDHLAEWLEQQGNRCQACHETSAGLAIDHDHSCCGRDRACGPDGCVRGLLCRHCNTTLGRYRDNPDALLALVDYLLKARGE